MPTLRSASLSVPEGVEERMTSGFVVATRVTLGLVWLYSAGWKIPPHFRSLERFTRGATGATEVLPPYGWLVDTVVLPNFHLFGWLTLLVEALLGALLVLGLWTRTAALAGLAMTIAISLSVLRLPDEWPHAYFMMAALHLAVFALDAGRRGGLDGVLASADARRWRNAVRVLGSVGVAVGAGGFVRARGTGFSSGRGLAIGPRDRDFELTFMTYNRLGALVTMLLSGLVLAAGSRVGEWRRRLLLVAAGGFAFYAVQVLVQFRRPLQGATTGGVFGSNGCTLAFALLMMLGCVVLGRRQPILGTVSEAASETAPEPDSEPASGSVALDA